MGKLRLLGVAFGVALAILNIGVVSAAGDPGQASPPGQVKKAEEHADQPAPPGQLDKETTEPAPAAEQPVQTGAQEQASTGDVAPSSHSPGTPEDTEGPKHEEKAKPKPAQPAPAPRAQGEPAHGNSAVAHVHVIICHRTGSRTNPYVVINISKAAWLEGHTTHPPLNGHSDILLKEGAAPGEKMPRSACGAPANPDTPQPPQIVTPSNTPSNRHDDTKPSDPKPADPAKPSTPDEPALPPELPQGGVAEGEQGAAGSIEAADAAAELPFTGVPLWLAVFAGCLLLGTGLAIRKASWAPGTDAQRASASTSAKKADRISR